MLGRIESLFEERIALLLLIADFLAKIVYVRGEVLVNRLGRSDGRDVLALILSQAFELGLSLEISLHERDTLLLELRGLGDSGRFLALEIFHLAIVLGFQPRILGFGFGELLV